MCGWRKRNTRNRQINTLCLSISPKPKLHNGLVSFLFHSQAHLRLCMLNSILIYVFYSSFIKMMVLRREVRSYKDNIYKSKNRLCSIQAEHINKYMHLSYTYLKAEYWIWSKIETGAHTPQENRLKIISPITVSEGHFTVHTSGEMKMLYIVEIPANRKIKFGAK